MTDFDFVFHSEAENPFLNNFVTKVFISTFLFANIQQLIKQVCGISFLRIRLMLLLLSMILHLFIRGKLFQSSHSHN
jgi:hypothetical protein